MLSPLSQHNGSSLLQYPLLHLVLLASLSSTTLALTYIDDADASLTYQTPQGTNTTHYNAEVASANLTDLLNSYSETYTGISAGASVIIPFSGTGISIYTLEAPWQAQWGRNLTFTLNPPALPSAHSSPSNVLLPPTQNPVQIYNTSIYALNGVENGQYTLTMTVNAYKGSGDYATLYWDYAKVLSEVDKQEGAVLSTSTYVVSRTATSTASALGASKKLNPVPIIGTLILIVVLALLATGGFFLFRRLRRRQRYHRLARTTLDLDAEPRTTLDFEAEPKIGGVDHMHLSSPVGAPMDTNSNIGIRIGANASQTTLGFANGQEYTYTGLPNPNRMSLNMSIPNTSMGTLSYDRGPASASGGGEEKKRMYARTSASASSASGSASRYSWGGDRGGSSSGSIGSGAPIPQYRTNKAGRPKSASSLTVTNVSSADLVDPFADPTSTTSPISVSTSSAVAAGSGNSNRPLTESQRAHLHALVASGAPPVEIARAVEEMQRDDVGSGVVYDAPPGYEEAAVSRRG